MGRGDHSGGSGYQSQDHGNQSVKKKKKKKFETIDHESQMSGNGGSVVMVWGMGVSGRWLSTVMVIIRQGERVWQT